MTCFDHHRVLAASGRIQGYVRHTPVVESSAFEGYLKLESLQHTGAYKVRGALHALMRQVEVQDFRPVIAASAGNHAAGVAWAARAMGLPAIVVVPQGAPRVKTDRTEALGAQVIRHGDDFEGAFAQAQRLASLHDWRFLHPFDDVDVIAGQGSIGVELLSFRPDVVAIPIGGGGLAAGVGTLLHAYGIPVVGVQIKGVNAMEHILRRRQAPFVVGQTIADGICVQQPGRKTAAICKKALDDIILVTEEEVRHAMVRLLLEDHVIAEGAGAVAVAALPYLTGKKKVAVVSGGNVDPAVLTQLLDPVASREKGKTMR